MTRFSGLKATDAKTLWAQVASTGSGTACLTGPGQRPHGRRVNRMRITVSSCIVCSPWREGPTRSRRGPADGAALTAGPLYPDRMLCSDRTVRYSGPFVQPVSDGRRHFLLGAVAHVDADMAASEFQLLVILGTNIPAQGFRGAGRDEM